MFDEWLLLECYFSVDALLINILEYQDNRNSDRSRSRSRSPIRRRRMSDNLDHDDRRGDRRGGFGRREDRRGYDGGSDRGGYGGRRDRGGFGRRRGDRGGYSGRGYERGYSRGYGGPPRRGIRESVRDDVRDGVRGPRLARELDSTYEEKMNRNYGNSIFVGNLTYDCQPEDLKDYFSQIGEVVRADIITSRGHHRGMGTVEFTNADDVDEAIRRFDGSTLLDREIFVRQDNPPPESMRAPPRERRPRIQASAPGYEVFIANLPYSVNWQALKDMFKECGDVLRADVKLDRDGYSRGYGVVYYKTKEEVQVAIERYNGYELEGRVLDVHEGKLGPASEHQQQQEQFQPQDDEPVLDFAPQTHESLNTEFTETATGGGDQSSTIFVDNLPWSTAQSDLFDLFETIGKVNRAELKFAYNGKPSGAAVVEYDNPADAEVCISRLNSYNYGGRDLDISYVSYQ